MSDKSVNKGAAATNDSFSELARITEVIHDHIEILITAGAVISFAALMCLCGALIMGLTSYMPPVIATLVTGLALALVGVFIALNRYRQGKNSLTLRTNANTKREDKEWLK